MDFDSIPPGVDFREQIKNTIKKSDLVIAIIGSRWLGIESDGSRRIDDPSDLVRLEIECALKAAVPVIPLLLNSVVMPKAETMPPSIQSLAFRNALPLDSGMDFHQHVDRLVSGIKEFGGAKHGNVIDEKMQSRARSPARLVLIAAIAIALAISVFWWFAFEQPRLIANQKLMAEENAKRRQEQEIAEAKRRADAAEAERKAEEARKVAAAEELRKQREAAEAKRVSDAAESERKAEEAQKAAAAEELRKRQEAAEAKRHADAAEAERIADEKRKAEEARIAALPKTITVPSDEPTVSAAMVRAKKGDTVKLKPGTYQEQIIFKDGVTLKGDARKAVVVRTDASQAAMTIENCTSGKISEITFEHEDTAVEPSKSWVIYIANSHVEVSDCSIRNGGGFGIMIERSASPAIHDCIVEKNTWSGIIINDNGTAPKLRSNQCRENGQSGIYFNRGSRGTVEKTVCEKNQSGISVANQGTNVDLRSNHCRENRYNGIWFYDGSVGVAEGNVCEANHAGILTEGIGTKPYLMSNHCLKNEAGLAFGSGASGTAEKNDCESNDIGMMVQGAGTSVTIAGNHVFNGSGSDGAGISVQEGATASVISNTLENNPGCGIFIGSGASPTIQQNTCRFNRLNGIVFRGGAGGMATGNNCEQNIGKGIATGDQGTSPQISGNRLVGNTECGIFVGIGSSPTIGPNSIGQNGTGYPPIYYEGAAH